VKGRHGCPAMRRANLRRRRAVAKKPGFKSNRASPTRRATN
jgi:hypothetical protein